MGTHRLLTTVVAAVAVAASTSCSRTGPGANAGTFERVDMASVSVIDGDTLRVVLDGRRERVRILGVDAPEVGHDGLPGECWGEEATTALRALVDSGEVTLVVRAQVDDRDRYDRLLRQVLVDSVDAAAVLLANGDAVTYRALTDSALRNTYLELEGHARDAESGLWSACPA